MELNFCSGLEKVVVRLNMDVKVEFRVAHMPRVLALSLTVSKAMIMVGGRPEGVRGTQSVFPRFAMICKRILVAMLCRFFFLKVMSVVIWQMILCFSSASCLTFLY